jgi:FlaA1/EpsC-like NDP-sugar epimerase
VRFGNVVGSRGSLVPVIAAQVEKGGSVTVTDPRMTRFLMTIADAVGLVLEAGAVADGGEVFILKMPVVRVGDLIQAIVDVASARCGKDPASIKTTAIGIRAGEKMDEELLTSEEIRRTVDRGSMFAVLPPHRAAEPREPAAIDPALYNSSKAPCLNRAGILDLLKRAGST